jgi:hypothetical protein
MRIRREPGDPGQSLMGHGGAGLVQDRGRVGQVLDHGQRQDLTRVGLVEDLVDHLEDLAQVMVHSEVVGALGDLLERGQISHGRRGGRMLADVLVEHGVVGLA